MKNLNWKPLIKNIVKEALEFYAGVGTGLLTAIILSLLFLDARLSINNWSNYPVKPGQTWVHNSSPDPFVIRQPDRYRILAVKNGYVQYADTTGHVDSDSESWFMEHNHLVK